MGKDETQLKPSTLTAERLREILHYDPETGVITWAVPTSRRAKPGMVAGTVLRYIIITVESRRYSGHQLAWLYMTGEWPKCVLDHRDGNGLNNRWTNIREATFSQNSQNARKSKSNTSGFKGVSWDKYTQRWVAKIRIDGRCKNLGRFDDPENAHKAYVIAAERNFGEFARAA